MVLALRLEIVPKLSDDEALFAVICPDSGREFFYGTLLQCRAWVAVNN